MNGYSLGYSHAANFQFLPGTLSYPLHYPSAGAFREEIDVPSCDDDYMNSDSHAQLRSQQLNSDGTPRRPMNAFMIFARKRRPMVSSEQPTMRTGEISKILSKEWSEMPKEDKQFYLDQAKKLKDTFNMRWPDYVYRRRPNNSRKRRKQGGSSIGPIRNIDTGRDDRPGTPNESTTSRDSGDELQPLSADSLPSPLSAQSRLLYPPGTISRGSPIPISGSSPTPSVASAGYGLGAPYLPAANRKFSSEHLPLDRAEPQGVLYPGGRYEDLNTGLSFDPNHPAKMNAQIQNWHPFNDGHSNSVESMTPPSPPSNNSPSLLVQSSLPVHISGRAYESSAWSENTAGSESRTSAQLWGASSSLEHQHGADRQGVPGLLSNDGSNLVLSNPLDFGPEGHSGSTHSFGEEVRFMNEGYRPSTYISTFGFAPPTHDSQPSCSGQSFDGSLISNENSPAPYARVNSFVS